MNPSALEVNYHAMLMGWPNAEGGRQGTAGDAVARAGTCADDGQLYRSAVAGGHRTVREQPVASLLDERGGAVRIAAAMRTRELVAISVEDDGVGMSPQVQARAYDPFFTTRMGSGRSGLGLHVAHNIVSNILGRRIEPRSAPNQGACFTLLVPLMAPHRPAPADAQP